MIVQEVINKLRKYSDPSRKKGMARFGIEVKYALGVSVPDLRKTAKEIGKDHKLAQELWKTKIHEARILSCFIDDPAFVKEKQMEAWVKDFDSWDVCDLCCSNLFDKTDFAYKKAFEWSKRKEEFVKRAGFALMAALSIHDKKAPDAKLMKFFPAIAREATDEQNYVKKAVNWALRQIGKRNKALNKEAIKVAKQIQNIDSKAAGWIAADALRELQSEAVKKRLK